MVPYWAPRLALFVVTDFSKSAPSFLRRAIYIHTYIHTYTHIYIYVYVCIFIYNGSRWCRIGRRASPCSWSPTSQSPPPLHRNVQRFRGGLVFKAHRLLYLSTLGLGVIKKKKAGKQMVPYWAPRLALFVVTDFSK